MKSSSARDWKVGDKGITKEGTIITVIEIVNNRHLKIAEDLEKKVYIPAHGEVEKI